MPDLDQDPPPVQAHQNPLDVVSRQLTKIAAIVAAVVALNTTLNSFTADRIAKYAAFHAAVSNEESFWKGLYEEYLTVFSPEMAKNEAQRVPKLFAIASLADHPIPTFREYSVPAPDKQQAAENLAALKKSLKDALASERASGTVVAQAVQAEAFNADEATKAQAAVNAAGASPAVAAPVQAAPTDTAGADSQTLAAGKTQGWDVDIFWCRGLGEEARYVTASNAAKALAGKASAGVSIAGVGLGRVRLRPLPVSIQQSRPGYQVSGNIIRYDDNAAERAATKVVAEIINAAQPNVFTPTPGVSNTRWYMSVFACAPPPKVATESGLPLATEAGQPMVAN